jgi:hypothetical protein
MLASEILRRIIMGATTTAVRAFPGGADVATFSVAGQVLGGALACGNISAADVAAATVNGSGVVSWAFTGEIDLLGAPGTLYAFSQLPVAAGKTLIGINTRFRWTARTGTATGNAQVSVGNNVTFDNFLSAAAGQISSAAITAAVAGSTTALGGGATVDVGTTAPRATVALAPTGVTVAKGILYMSPIYAAT